MPNVQNGLVRALFPLALMALIFVLSAQPNLGTGLGLIDLIGRKFVHAGVYATLTFLWWWALTPPRPSRPSRRRVGWAAAISFAYAVSDEYHQSFVEGRAGSPVDVGIDALGVAAAVWAILRFGARGPGQFFSRSARAE